MSLRGKIAIVTGSTGGIGKSIALHLASRGAQVVITSRSIDRAGAVAKEIVDRGELAFPCRFDLEDPASGQALIDIVLQTFKRLDILVNNAISVESLPPLPLEHMSLMHLQHALTVNLANVLALTAQAHPHLKESRGSLLNIGSVVVNRHMQSIPLYAILKGAMSQMTRSLAAEWAHQGIRVNQISPGLVYTDAFKEKGIPEEFQRAFFEHNKQFHPIGRLGIPQDIGSLAAYMLSEQAAWMTGSIVDIDGGYSIQGVSAPEHTMLEPGFLS